MLAEAVAQTAAATEPGNPKHTSSLLSAFVQVGTEKMEGDVAPKATLHNTTL